MSEDIGPGEVNALAGKILALISENISCSEDVLIAALKLASSAVDETRQANFSAKLRAEMFLQYRSKR